MPMKASTILNVEGQVVLRRDIVGSCGTTWVQLFRVLMLAFVEGNGEKSTTCKYRYSCSVRDIVQRDGLVEVSTTTDTGEEETLKADLVVGADGASSKVREILLPEIKRTYAGYVLLRGLVPVEEFSEETRRVTDSSATFCFTRNSQVISYTVPASKTGPPDSHNVLNWGWYQKKTEEELEQLMTDVTGKRHFVTLPQGAMREEVADEIRARAKKELPPQLLEAVTKTKALFVQVITDILSTQNMFWDGKVLLVGDAAAGQRPHTAMAVAQACFHAHLLRLYLQRSVSLEQWSKEVWTVSSTVVSAGQEMGPICLSETIEPGDKARLFLGKMLPCHKLLSERWAAFSAGGEQPHEAAEERESVQTSVRLENFNIPVKRPGL